MILVLGFEILAAIFIIGYRATEIKTKIENEMQYPGTIKITVVRETRAVEEAK